jgi:hypothetical protein
VGFFVFGVRMTDALKIGILFSTSGPYAPMGRDARDGAEFALAEFAAESGQAVEPVFFDPHADLSAYLDGARQLLRAGCRHIVGTITSAARKEVIPLVEKHDGLLWYMCPYEGFEANENVIYVGGCPNQHLIPLFEHLIPRFGARPYLVGANYVWGWEMNRLARELIHNAGGEVLGERYLPLEETAVDRIVADIEQRRPSFILNNLIGPSSYAFLAAIRKLGERDPAFRAENCPVVSCDLMECELDEIAPGAALGQLCAASYFDNLDTSDNLASRPAWPRISAVSAGYQACSPAPIRPPNCAPPRSSRRAKTSRWRCARRSMRLHGQRSVRAAVDRSGNQPCGAAVSSRAHQCRQRLRCHHLAATACRRSLSDGSQPAGRAETAGGIMRETPNFTGWDATVIHREDSNTERLIRQLRLLGVRVTLQWAPLGSGALPDLVIVDADQGWDDLLPWRDAQPGCPVVALLGSEAPGRIAWALEQGPAPSSPSRLRRRPSIRHW